MQVDAGSVVFALGFEPIEDKRIEVQLDRSGFLLQMQLKLTAVRP
jgi:hypothetical protein